MLSSVQAHILNSNAKKHFLLTEKKSKQMKKVKQYCLDQGGAKIYTTMPPFAIKEQKSKN